MDFALNEEQLMLQEATKRYLADAHPTARARKALPWSDASQRELWKSMADMGWNALLLSDESGGSGLGLVEASLIAESAGQYLLNLPWASSAVLLVLLQQEAGSLAPAALHEAVESLIQGQRSWHCVTQNESSWDFSEQCSDFVWLRGLYDETGPLQLAFIPSNALEANLPALDPTLSMGSAPQVELAWHSIELPRASRERICRAYRLMLASELVGVGQAALSLSTDYAKERTQFGKAIGSYQSIKHQLANMWIGVDNARLSVMYAAAAMDSHLPDQPLACAVAEVAAIEGALQTTRAAVQVHGALGFTWEHDVHLYLKRAQHLATRLGGISNAFSKVESIGLQMPASEVFPIR